MDSQRFGPRESTINVFLFIENTAEYRQLCEPCCHLTAAEQEAAEYLSRPARLPPQSSTRRVSGAATWPAPSADEPTVS